MLFSQILWQSLRWRFQIKRNAAIWIRKVPLDLTEMEAFTHVYGAKHPRAHTTPLPSNTPPTPHPPPPHHTSSFSDLNSPGVLVAYLNNGKQPVCNWASLPVTWITSESGLTLGAWSVERGWDDNREMLHLAYPKHRDLSNKFNDSPVVQAHITHLVMQPMRNSFP